MQFLISLNIEVKFFILDRFHEVIPQRYNGAHDVHNIIYYEEKLLGCRCIRCITHAGHYSCVM